MLPSTIVRALTTPAFEPDHFTATQWSTAEDKAKFANALMKFIADEFPRQSFSKAIYQRLRAANVIEVFRMREADATRTRELDILARLQAKYGANRELPSSPPQTSPPQADLFAT